MIHLHASVSELKRSEVTGATAAQLAPSRSDREV
jgi:hypothetical protein